MKLFFKRALILPLIFIIVGCGGSNNSPITDNDTAPNTPSNPNTDSNQTPDDDISTPEIPNTELLPEEQNTDNDSPEYEINDVVNDPDMYETIDPNDLSIQNDLGDRIITSSIYGKICFENECKSIILVITYVNESIEVYFSKENIDVIIEGIEIPDDLYFRFTKDKYIVTGDFNVGSMVVSATIDFTKEANEYLLQIEDYVKAFISQFDFIEFDEMVRLESHDFSFEFDTKNFLPGDINALGKIELAGYFRIGYTSQIENQINMPKNNFEVKLDMILSILEHYPI